MSTKLINGIKVFLILTGVLSLFFLIEHSINSDAIARFQAIKMLIENHKFSDTPYSLVGSIFSIPFWFLGLIIKNSEWWLARFNLFLLIGFLLFVWFSWKKYVEKDFLINTILIMISLSLFVPYSQNFMGEMFTAIMAGIGITLLASNKTFGWIFLILGVANTPATLVGFGLISIYFVFKEKKIRFFIYPILAFLLILLESYIRRGSLFSTGYEGNHGFETILPYSGLSGFSYPFILGFVSILFSFGKGLFWFLPSLWFLKDIKNYYVKNKFLFEIVALSCIFLIGEIVVYSKWWAWYGGLYWGPRFFLITAIPASVILSTVIKSAKQNSYLKNVIVLIAVFLSGWLSISGLVFGQENLSICSENNFQYEFLCWYVPEFSVLIRPFIVFSDITLKDILFITYIMVCVLILSIPIIKVLLIKSAYFIKIIIDKIKTFRI